MITFYGAEPRRLRQVAAAFRFGGTMTVEELCGRFEITSVNLRQVLSRLVSRGLLTRLRLGVYKPTAALRPFLAQVSR